MNTTLMKARACEGFIRRAAQVQGPFVLKGSYLSRQFFPEPQTRIPQDLDWYCTQTFGDFEEADKLFQIWLLAVLNSPAEDGVRFQSVENKHIYWENADYAMYNYFATVKTTLHAEVDGEKLSFQLEMSLNWPIPFEPVPFEYQDLHGQPIALPKIAPLYTQLAWKIHQCAIEPRMKDFVDIYFMLAHPLVQAEENFALRTVEMVKEELEACEGDMDRLEDFLKGNLSNLFYDDESADYWQFWRADNRKALWNDYWDNVTFSDLYRGNDVPFKIEDFWQLLTDRLEEKGFVPSLLEKI